MNKKADIKLSTESLISIVLFVVAATVVVYIIFQIRSVTVEKPDQPTLDNFLRLGREIEDLVKDLENKEKGAKAEIPVPLSIQKMHYIQFFPEKKECKQSCICLYFIKTEEGGIYTAGTPKDTLIECVDLKDIYGTPIIIPKDMSKSQIFNVKVILTKEPKEEGIYSLQIIEQTT